MWKVYFDSASPREWDMQTYTLHTTYLFLPVCPKIFGAVLEGLQTLVEAIVPKGQNSTILKKYTLLRGIFLSYILAANPIPILPHVGIQSLAFLWEKVVLPLVSPVVLNCWNLCTFESNCKNEYSLYFGELPSPMLVIWPNPMQQVNPTLIRSKFLERWAFSHQSNSKKFWVNINHCIRIGTFVCFLLESAQEFLRLHWSHAGYWRHQFQGFFEAWWPLISPGDTDETPCRAWWKLRTVSSGSDDYSTFFRNR